MIGFGFFFKAATTSQSSLSKRQHNNCYGEKTVTQDLCGFKYSALMEEDIYTVIVGMLEGF